MTEDLKLKIGSAEEVFWCDLKTKIESDTVGMRRQIEVNEHLLAFVNAKIEKEKEKLK